MEENKKNVDAEESNSKTYTRQRTDVDTFLGLLPNLVGAFASKHNEPKTASDLAIQLAREETAHMVQMGCCEAVTMCRDGRPLALSPNMREESTLALGNGRSKQGAVVAQFENQNITRIQGL